MSELSDTFDALAGSLDYSMLIVTAAAGTERAGCLVGFATQCSIDPPRFLVCISTNNRTFALADRSECLLVHVVPAEAERLAELFGGRSGDELDKFAHTRWHPGPGGLPLLDDCSQWFAGSICQRLPCGDHVGFLLEPFAAQSADGRSGSLMFSHAQQIDPGHAA